MENILEIEITQETPKSGHEMGRKSRAPATTHGSLARLKQRIQRNTKKYYGDAAPTQFFLRVQCRRQREWFGLGGDLDEAAKLARDVQRHLRLHGWVATRNKYKPAFEIELCDLTVGAYINLVSDHGRLHPATLDGYAARFRRIVATARKIRFGGADKYVGGPRPSKWRQAVDSVLLTTITPSQIEMWRDNYVGRFPVDHARRANVEHSANAIIRSARLLFGKRVLRRLLTKIPNLVLPSPLPFEGVEFIPERESDYFYTSEVDAKQLIDDALKELSGNQLVIFVLAIGAGLRRNEIDKLPWRHVDLATGVVTVAPTQYTRLKSDSSVGRIQLEPRFAEVLRKHGAESRGEFVLPSPIAPRINMTQHRYYRCDRDCHALCSWLRQKGMARSRSCIHTLRKEFGSHLAQRRGIFVASAGLRHSTIGVTRKYYVSSKIEPTAFFAAGNDQTAPDALQLLELIKKTLAQGGATAAPAA